MSAELVVGNSFAAVELFDSSPDFCIDGFAVLLKPPILPGGRAGLQGRLQAGMTSSLTIWSRMTLGFSVGSKWQETASLIMVLSSSRESASVKMENLSAVAW
jgi:hypothetical protein